MLTVSMLDVFLQVIEIGSVGKGFDQGVKTFFAHTSGVIYIYIYIFASGAI